MAEKNGVKERDKERDRDRDRDRDRRDRRRRRRHGRDGDRNRERDDERDRGRDGSKEQYDRRDRGRYGRRHPSRDKSNASEHSPSPHRVIILTKSHTTNANEPASSPAPVEERTQLNQQQAQPAPPPAITHPSGDDLARILNDMSVNMPKTLKLIHPESWAFNEIPAIDYLYSDSANMGGFTVISACGPPSTGKSTVLNQIANRDIFKTHTNLIDGIPLLRNVTRGVDLHITPERLLLLDSQPLLSMSVLDDLNRAPHVPGTMIEISEPGNRAHVISLQLICFLLAVSDYMILVIDWSIDLHLLRLLATAIMMIGSHVQKAHVFIHSKEKMSYDLQTSVEAIVGRSCVTFTHDNETLAQLVMRPPSRIKSNDQPMKYALNSSSEKSWLLNAQRLWESSIRKSPLYADYASKLP